MLNKKSADKLDRYLDPTGEFSNRALKLSVWYVEHKLLLKKIGLTSLFVFCIITVGYSLLYWGYYFTTGYWNDQKMLAQQTLELENYDSLKHFYAPKPFSLGSVAVYQTVSPANYDLVAEIINNNERWVADIVYQFVFSGGETPLAEAVILPGTRPVAYFGFVSSAGYPSGAKFAIKNISWRHLNRHQYPDVKAFVAEHSQWEMTNFKFSSQSRLTGIPSNRIQFSLTNYSPYNFWKASFYVELLSQGERVGMVFLPEEKFLAKETRQVDLRSFIGGLYADEAKIYPLINVFDTAEYMSVGAQ